ncbi:MAG: PIN domain-containing protein [Peptococcaceae bacterium]|jgi:predicted nucleic acid-binding protein|nr:PIN domain-containing protein [Peptococcaceae bacterium]
MNVLIDTNVMLDVLLKREPFAADAAKIIFFSERNFITAFISASTATDIFYLARKQYQNKEKTYALIKKLFTAVKIASVDESAIKRALALYWDDCEDCIQYVAAQDSQTNYIVTRDVTGFALSDIPAISPADFVELISPTV